VLRVPGFGFRFFSRFSVFGFRFFGFRFSVFGVSGFGVGVKPRPKLLELGFRHAPPRLLEADSGLGVGV